ncbi:MAG: AraC family transcriptional regulator [Candidatus Thiodiazotropha sp. 6PLUC2]
MKQGQATIYTDRMNRVFDKIDQHLDEDLSIDQLSDIAHFSRFHFQRQFSAYVGMSVTRYIQLLRLRRASYQLVFSEHRQIIDIGLEAGFENPESFSRAFKKRFGQTPSQFRDKPAWQPWNEQMQLPERDRRKAVEVDIIDFEETRIAVLEHHGSPDRILESVQIFIAWRKESALSPIATSRTFGIPYSDPNNTPAEQFQFDICGEASADIPANAQGVTTKRIPAGRCAKVRHIGSTDRIDESIYPLYRDWLPESGEELRDFPPFFHYLKRVPDVPEHEQITDIYLPLE